MIDLNTDSRIGVLFPSLGINTKSRTAPSRREIDPTIERFFLQSQARELLPDERVSGCLRLPIPKSLIEIYHAHQTNTVHYGGLVVCGSVWHCPVCAAKVAQRRLLELQGAIVTARGMKYQIAMTTFTISHHNREPASDVLKKLLDNYQQFWRGRAIQRIKDQIGYLGKVRSLEVTYGQNGWHAHIHTLLFYADSSVLSTRLIELSFKERWQTTVLKGGDYASLEHGVTLKSADDFIAEYMAKFNHLPRSAWTEAHEVVHSHKKKSNKNGATPMQLLSMSAYGDLLAGEIWREYATAFKGKRQLSWSPGLKNYLQVGEDKSDYDLATETDSPAILLASLSREQWGIVLANDIRGEILNVAKSGDAALLMAFLEEFGIYA